MAIVSFVVYGEPMGKQRPKHRTFVTGSGKTINQEYTPKKTVNLETLVKTEYGVQTGNYFFPEGTPLFILIDYFLTVPQASKKKTLEMLGHILRPQKMPDWDNVGKIICDALNKVAYKDDKQVVDGRVRKFWSQRPRVVVTISDQEINFSNYNVKKEEPHNDSP